MMDFLHLKLITLSFSSAFFRTSCNLREVKRGSKKIKNQSLISQDSIFTAGPTSLHTRLRGSRHAVPREETRCLCDGSDLSPWRHRAAVRKAGPGFMTPFPPGMNLIPGGGSSIIRSGWPHLWQLTWGLPERVAAQPGRRPVSRACSRRHLLLPGFGERSLQHGEPS